MAVRISLLSMTGLAVVPPDWEAEPLLLLFVCPVAEVLRGTDVGASEAPMFFFSGCCLMDEFSAAVVVGVLMVTLGRASVLVAFDDRVLAMGELPLVSLFLCLAAGSSSVGGVPSFEGGRLDLAGDGGTEG